MVIGHLVGAAMMLPAIAYYLYDTPKRRFKRILKASFQVHKLKSEYGEIEILNLESREYGYYTEILLPSGLTVEQFEKSLPAV